MDDYTAASGIPICFGDRITDSLGPLLGPRVMALPRHLQVNPEITRFYHTVGRCVRRSFLCGFDEQSGKDYEHRRQWIVDRLRHLAEVFAIEVLAYAVMNNHYHLVLRLDPQSAASWSSEEVMKRWMTIFNAPAALVAASRVDATGADSGNADAAIETCRERLTSLSWFMKCLNEYIARKANAEDRCTGHFWEGRFKSQALLDERALLSCMVYVDLNPIRAAMAASPEESDFTSVYQRIHRPERLAIPLAPFDNEAEEDEEAIPTSFEDYLELVDWTGRVVVEGKRGAINDTLPPILNRLRFSQHTWAGSMKLFKNAELRALGATEAIRDMASRCRKQWFRGLGVCRMVFDIR